MPKAKPVRKSALRILAIDTSLSSPGIAVVAVKSGKAQVIAVSHVKTDSSDSYAIRTKHIESWAHLFIRGHTPYDVIVREGFTSKMPTTQYAIFSAWNAIDRALADFGLAVTEKPIAQSAVKKAVVGKGKAEKSEVEAAVRRITGYDGEFATSDESDAVAIALAWAVGSGVD